MARTDERGGPRTRARILEASHELFLDRGYDAVTVAQVAQAAGVSSVTVFKHFPRKEDLFFDRTDEAIELVRRAVRDRSAGVGVLDGLEDATLRAFEERHPLSGVDERSLPFFRTVAGSAALSSRAREIGAELQAALRDELARDAGFSGDPDLLAALFIAGYASVLVRTARQVIDGAEPHELIDEHRARLDALFAALRGGLRG